MTGRPKQEYCSNGHLMSETRIMGPNGSQCGECRRIGFQRTHRKRSYDLSPAEYEDLVAQSGGVCAICGEPEGDPFRNGTLSIDHDHASGKVRGLLCNKHNRGLGAFDDNPDLLRKALEYLEGQEGRE